MNHTPGPWKGWPDGCITADDMIVAEVNLELVSHAQGHADITLIAAAVEMRDILIRAADAIEVLEGTSVGNEKLLDDYRALMARLA